MISRFGKVAAAALLLALAACGGGAAPAPSVSTPPDIHIPPFAKRPTSRSRARRRCRSPIGEWRAFGQKLCDLVPNTKAPGQPRARRGAMAAGRRVLVARARLRRARRGLDRPPRRQRHRVPARPGRRVRLVGGVRRLCHAHGRGRPAVSLFVEPQRLHQRRAHPAGPCGQRSAARPIRAAIGRPHLHVARQQPGAVRGFAGGALPRPLRHRRRAQPRRARRDRRQRRQRGVDERACRSAPTAVSSALPAPWSTPTIRGLSR